VIIELATPRRVAVLLQEERHDLDILFRRETSWGCRGHQLGYEIEDVLDVKIVAGIGEIRALECGPEYPAG